MASRWRAAIHRNRVSGNVNAVWGRARIDADLKPALLALGMAGKIPAGTHQVGELGELVAASFGDLSGGLPKFSSLHVYLLLWYREAG